MLYQLEWKYSDLADDGTRLNRDAEYIYFDFLLRFPDIPPGKGHCEFFCFHLLPNPPSDVEGVKRLKRGFLVSNPVSKVRVERFVEDAIEARSNLGRETALEAINEDFIWYSRDFSGEFCGDLLQGEALLSLIHDAFDGVERGNGITLHQADVIDDYGTQEEFSAAADLDTEERWQDVPDASLNKNHQFMTFLDVEGFRYYLPAVMSWAIRNHEDEWDPTFYAYLAVLPTVAPRETGLGMGEAFDVDGFIRRHSFTQAQIRAIYEYIVFMAIKAGHEMDEDQYAAVKKWRAAALC